MILRWRSERHLRILTLILKHSNERINSAPYDVITGAGSTPTPSRPSANLMTKETEKNVSTRRIFHMVLACV